MRSSSVIVHPREEELPSIAAYTDDIENYAKPANYLAIGPGEHWGIVGRTGSGKTYFAIDGLLNHLRQLHPEVPRYILDSTADPKLPNLVFNPLFVEGNHVPDLLRTPEYTQVWRPHNSKIPLQYQEWFDKFIDSREPAIVVLNEIASITRQALAGLETLFKQLRQYGGIVVALTQRMSKVDTDIFSQLTHFVQLQINPEPYDLLMARSYLNMPKEDQKQPRKYGFFYRRTDGDYPYQEFGSYSEFFRS